MYTRSAQSSNSPRLSKNILTPNQQEAITDLYEKNTLLVAQMGFGKSVVAATAMAELLDDEIVKRILVVTTPKIANTVWEQEFDKWEHTHHINIKAATQDPDTRTDIILGDAQIVVITFNVLPWMKTNKLFQYFDGLLIDETTKLKVSGGAQFKALRNQLKNFTWRVGLTGTPVSENFESLYAQAMLIDAGQALGTNKDKFLREYFYPTDYKEYNWVLKEGADKRLLGKVKHLVHVAKDYTKELPPINYHDVPVQLPPDVSEFYAKLKKDMVVGDLMAQTEAVLIQKLQQVASGFIYDELGEAQPLSKFRIYALLDLLKTIKRPVIIAYWFKEDLERLRHYLPEAKEITPKNMQKVVAQWNKGEIQTLLIHPRSAGHGLQLEQGGHDLIWYTPQWSNDLDQQTNARLWRRGQKNEVNIYSIIAEHTIDELIVNRVESKTQFDKIFKEHLGS